MLVLGGWWASPRWSRSCDGQTGQGVTAEDPYLCCAFHCSTPLPFVALGFLVPLMSIGLADLVNGEPINAPEPVLSQPVRRAPVRHFASLTTISDQPACLPAARSDLTVMLGIPPGGEEVARAFIFLLVTIAYAGVWLALALLLSIVFRSAATAALSALGLWLFLTILWPLMMPLVASLLTPSGDVLALLDTQQILARISPSSLFSEVVAVILDPSLRSTQQSMFAQMGLMLLERGAIPGAPIPLLESLMVVWGQIVGLVAGTILLFVIGYVVFQRQEVRA